MFLISDNNHDLLLNMEAIGLTNEIINMRDVLIKINLSRPYTKNLPRTDMTLLKTLVEYIYENDGRCALAEGANGYLKDNLIISGFDNMLRHYGVNVVDIDLEDCDEVLSYGEQHYIPKCFQDYPVRIAVPSASKRKDMLYSNNIKLFVGAVPRKMYQCTETEIAQEAPRPKIHQNLHVSIANLLHAIQKFSPFQFYVNGGLAYNENIGEFNLVKTFIGNNAIDLDCYIYQKYFTDCEYPYYLDILKTRLNA